MTSTPDPSARHRGPLTVLAGTVLAIALVAGCGSDDDDGASATTAPPATEIVASVPETTTAAPTTPPTSDAATTTTSSPPVDDAWLDEVAAACDDFLERYLAIAPPVDPSAPSVGRFANEVLAIADLDEQLAAIDVPTEQAAGVDQAAAFLDASNAFVQEAADAAAVDDADAANQALELAQDEFYRTVGALAMVGARCGEIDPSSVQTAALTIPTKRSSFLITSAFDSIWINERLTGSVRRLDPTDGSELATIEVGSPTFRVQAADGRLWVRTADRYVAVDPGTNQVVETLLMSDVGPAAGRSWAVDGAMWICDGQQLHRYDPTTVERVATIDLGIDCTQVQADEDLVIAWNYNEDDGESGATVVTFIDPTTNAILATVPMPVDVTNPAMLADSVFFPGNGGSTAVVVNRGDWTISETVDLGIGTRSAGAETDGSRIFVPAGDDRVVLVVDAETFEVLETISVLHANAVALENDRLWVVDAEAASLQRFDLTPS